MFDAVGRKDLDPSQNNCLAQPWTVLEQTNLQLNRRVYLLYRSGGPRLEHGMEIFLL